MQVPYPSFKRSRTRLERIGPRLEKEGIIEGSWEEEGRRRKVYALTEKGEGRLTRQGGSLLDAFGTLTRMLGGEGGSLRPRPAAG